MSYKSVNVSGRVCELNNSNFDRSFLFQMHTKPKLVSPHYTWHDMHGMVPQITSNSTQCLLNSLFGSKPIKQFIFYYKYI